MYYMSSLSSSTFDLISGTWAPVTWFQSIKCNWLRSFYQHNQELQWSINTSSCWSSYTSMSTRINMLTSSNTIRLFAWDSKSRHNLYSLTFQQSPVHLKAFFALIINFSVSWKMYIFITLPVKSAISAIIAVILELNCLSGTSELSLFFNWSMRYWVIENRSFFGSAFFVWEMRRPKVHILFMSGLGHA